MKLLLVLLTIFASSVFGSDNIILIYVDEKTEKSLGDFPISRSHYAKLIRTVSKYRPKYIVLKFFYDLQKAEDKELITEVKKYNNIFTQAFSYGGGEESHLDISKYSISATGIELRSLHSLMFPYKEMAEAFSGVGFVNGITTEDGRAKDFEIISSFKGKAYPSLPLVILEKELEAKSIIQDKVLKVGSKVVTLPRDFGMGLDFKKPGSYKSYSMIDVINENVAKDKIENKILIVFYDGDKLSPVPAVNGHSYNPAEIVANAIDHVLSW